MTHQPTTPSDDDLPDAPVDDPGDGQTTPSTGRPPGEGTFTGTPGFGVDDPERVAAEAQAGGSPAAEDRPEDRS